MKCLAGERPGIYTEYDTSGVVGDSQKAAVGLAVVCSLAEGKSHCITRLSEAQEYLRNDEVPLEMAEALLDQGIREIWIAPAGEGDAEGYAAALRLLEEISLKSVLSDSSQLEIHQLMKESIHRCAQQKRERTGVVFTDEIGEEAIRHGEALNSERMVLVAQKAERIGGSEAVTGAAVSAALAGIVASAQPGTNFNGSVLKGFSSVQPSLEEETVDSFLQGGVTPLEKVGNEVQAIRIVTTRTTTGGVQDKTYRDINTVLVMDDVISSVREALSIRLGGAKNNTRTRGAIATQAAVELQAKLDAGMIDSYNQPRIYADSEDPSICIVELEFSVVRGLNQIHIIGHISI